MSSRYLEHRSQDQCCYRNSGLDARAAQLRKTSDDLRTKMTDSLNLIATGIANLQSHSIKEDYVMTALSPEDFAKEATTAPLDFNKLKSDFNLICTDFDTRKTFTGKYLAVDFCKRMLYEVGPKSREVRRRQGTGDNTYRFNFMYDTSAGLVHKVAVVCTFKNVSYVPVSATSERMVLTIKEASLLALYPLSEIHDIIYENTGTGIFTPLCGAVFNYDAVSIIEKGQKFGNIPNICKILTESSSEEVDKMIDNYVSSMMTSVWRGSPRALKLCCCTGSSISYNSRCKRQED